MKKLLNKVISITCCLALLFGLAAALPGVEVSASEKSVTLYIEAANKTLYSGSVELKDGDSTYDVIVRALESAGYAQTESASDTSAGTFYIPDGTYGRSLERIGTYASSTSTSTYWGFYINNEYASLGISSEIPSSGDTIVIAYGDYSQYYPTATLSSSKPVKGQNYTVDVKATVSTAATGWVPTETKIADATIYFNGKTYTTDSSGSASVTMPSSAGSYELVIAEKDDSSGYPTGIRSVSTVKVCNSANDSDSGYNLSADDSIDVSTTQSVSASLGAVASGNTKTATVANDKSIIVRNGSKVLSLGISAGTVISGSSSWDGSLLLPQIVSGSSVSVANGSSVLAVKTGADGEDLSLSKPARLVLPGMSGKSAGYVGADGVFHRITTALSSDSAPDNAGKGYTAVYDNGTDLIVYTTHFTTFVAYTDTSSASSSDKAIASALKSAASVLKSKDTSQWAAFALARAGYEPTDDYLSGIKSDIEENGGDYSYPTSLAKAVLTLEANGYDAASFCGVNLIEKLYNYGDIELSGLNGPVYALIALDGVNADIPSGSKWTAEKLIDKILGSQNSDGGFSFSSGYGSDVDMTAITVTALAPHYDETAVKTAVGKALSWISSQQGSNGGFTTVYGESSETVSQVIVALCSLGLDPKTDSDFIKNGNTLLDSLMTYKVSSGGFEHTSGGGLNNIATEQAMMALTAYTRMENSENTLYDLSDVSAATKVSSEKSSENPKTGDPRSLAVSSAVTLAAALIFVQAAKKKSIK